MKQLILVRHAKSSWDNPLQKDFDRPLNDRGEHDAPVMAKRLKEKKVAVDAFISSPAVRALTTAEYFVEVYGLKRKDIIQQKDLYHASYDTLHDFITNLDDRYETVVIFSHNPGLTEFATDLTTVNIDNIPTCGIFAVKLNIKSWKEFADAEKKFWFFDYPKNA